MKKLLVVLLISITITLTGCTNTEPKIINVDKSQQLTIEKTNTNKGKYKFLSFSLSPHSHIYAIVLDEEGNVKNLSAQNVKITFEKDVKNIYDGYLYIDEQGQWNIKNY